MQLVKLREIRESKGIPVATLAEAAGLTEQHIYQLQNGKHSASSSTAILLAILLGTTVGSLCGETADTLEETA